MRLRSGFVSNSSSSSFILLVEKEEYDRVMEEAHPYLQAVAKAVSRERKCFGKDVVQMETFSTPGGSCWEWIDISYSGDIPEEYDEYAGEAFYALKKKFDKEKTFSASVDW